MKIEKVQIFEDCEEKLNQDCATGSGGFSLHYPARFNLAAAKDKADK
jgi:hypothetical protein